MSVSQPAGFHQRVPDALVLIHGFLDSHVGWDPLIAQWPAQAITIVAPDLRGAGARRNAAGPYSLEQAVDDVARLILEHDLYAVALVGHSMGAQIAELVAARLPDRTAALVLVTPTPLAGNTLPDDVRDLLRNCGGDAPAQRAIREMFSRQLPANRLMRLTNPENMMGKAAVQAYYDAFTGGHASGKAPCSFAGAVLVIAANEDPVIPVTMVEQTRAARFPGAALAVIERSGHWPQMEQPETTASLLASFLRLPAEA
ncbi:MAG: alpha/beta fold hydrolase [Cupriavidus necator]